MTPDFKDSAMTLVIRRAVQKKLTYFEDMSAKEGGQNPCPLLAFFFVETNKKNAWNVLKFKNMQQKIRYFCMGEQFL